jgi:hypothetical protein
MDTDSIFHVPTNKPRGAAKDGYEANDATFERQGNPYPESRTAAMRALWIGVICLGAIPAPGFAAQKAVPGEVPPRVEFVDGFFGEERAENRTWRWMGDRLEWH